MWVCQLLNIRHRFCTCGCCLLGFNISPLRGCCSFGLCLFRLRLLASGSHLWLFRCLCYWLEDWFGSWGRNAGLNNSPSSDNVDPTLAQFNLSSRGSRLLCFWGSRFALGKDIKVPFMCPLCKSRPCLFLFSTAQVVRRAVAPPAAVRGLSPRSRAMTREVRAPTRDAPSCVPAVELLMSEALAVLALQLATRRHVRTKLKVPYRSHKCPSPVAILSQLDPYFHSYASELSHYSI
jgi:hypothetical protein